MSPTLLLLLCLLSASPGRAIQPPNCDVAFHQCQDLYGGVIAGPSCFFVVNQAVTWHAAWSVCQARGATLAQTHTAAEFQATQLALTPLGYSVIGWIAMQRPGAVGLPCGVTSTTTFWYDGPSTPNPNMTAGKTWLRNNCDNNDGGGEYYFSWFPANYWSIAGSTMPYKLFDISDNFPGARPICQATAYSRNYTKSSLCITEAPIEEFEVSDLDDCTDACSSRLWCHSFKVVPGANATIDDTCQLFSFLSTEACTPSCPQTQAAEVEDCHQYDVDM